MDCTVACREAICCTWEWVSFQEATGMSHHLAPACDHVGTGVAPGFQVHSF